MSPDQKPEWFDITDADNATSPRKVAKTIPLLALAAAVAIIGLGSVFTQTQQEPPASAVENVTTPATQADPVATSTQPSTVVASSTPAAGSASMERTNPNPTLTIETVSTDNIGSSITGEKRDTIGFTHDNLLHLNDSFNINRTANDSDSYNKHRSTSTSGNFSMPLGRHTFTFSASKSSYFFLTGENKNIRTYGDTLTKTASLDSVLIKNKKFKISSNFNISSRYNQNFQNDEKIEVSSRKASIGTIGLSNTFFLNSASLFLKPSYSKALNILDAKKDAKNLPSKAAHAEFNIFKFYGNYGKKLTIPYLKTPASYSFNIDSQISQQKLNGIDQFSSGGFYSVRGFRNSSISGDSGYNIRNEFSANLGQLILPQFNSEKISKNLSYLNYFSLTPFYDYGFVRMKGGLQSGRLSGTGAKISFNKNNINASFTFSKATSKSMLLLQNRNEGSIIYFDIGAELGFF